MDKAIMNEAAVVALLDTDMGMETQSDLDELECVLPVAKQSTH